MGIGQGYNVATPLQIAHAIAIIAAGGKVYSGLGKAYLRLLVDEIRLDGNELVVTGGHRHLADAFGFMEKRKLGEVPSFVRDWRARDDSNVRPLPSEGSTLSS